MEILFPERMGGPAIVPPAQSPDRMSFWSKKRRAERPRKGENNNRLNVSSHNAS